MRNTPFLLAHNPPPHSLLLLCASNDEALYCADLLRYWQSERPVWHFPSWETLPYDRYRAPQELVNARLRLLLRLPQERAAYIVVSAPTLRQRLCPQSHLDRQGVGLRRDDALSREQLLRRLRAAGYRETRSLGLPGEMVVLPQQLDFYPLACPDPISVRWQDGRIVALRTLDLASNRTKIDSREIILPPPHELDLNALPSLPAGENPDYFLPACFKETASLLDYLPPATALLATPALAEVLRQQEQHCAQRWRPGQLPPDEVWWPTATLLERLAPLPRYQPRGQVEALPFAGTAGERQRQWEDYRRRFPRLEIHSASALDEDATVSPLRHSFASGDTAYLYRGDLLPPSASGRRASSLLQDLTELQPGDPLIHSDFGVGRYGGLETLEGEEMLRLDYAGGSVRLAVSELGRLTKYSGNPATAPLHSLGSKQWTTLRTKISRAVADTAAELLQLYAQRQRAPGISLSCSDGELERFAAAFPYQLTADQATAIAAVRADLAAPRPMDRLICGDVGFGKTEVALRASLIAVAAGHQVAVLAPTTLLAEQHEQKFAERFAGFGRLGALSRFKSRKEQQATLAALAAGELDLIIGTHRLLQSDVQFDRLGLVIVDEEQRFGVRAKERLKQLRQNVNLLTLSATPIPRTLNLALNGLRDLSIINTAPRGRQHIITQRCDWDDELIREALQRELARGGQIYFLHNDVASMERIEYLLRGLVPELRIGIAHGQMKERELEEVMAAFQEKRFDLLLASSIIESGLDLPNANTILINRADRFGLGQLHQLRGRVGRNRQQAYAYLITPPESQLSADARRRLAAFSALDSVGAGFQLASQDLEIRGAGEILGLEQSGKGTELGLGFYLDLLEEAIRRAAPDGQTVSPALLELGIVASLDPEQIRNPAVRLGYYQRLARSQNEAELRAIWAELEEQYGPVPAHSRDLFTLQQLRLLAEALGIEKMQRSAAGIALHFGPTPRLNSERLLAEVQSQPQRFQLRPDGLLFKLNGDENPLGPLRQLLQRIQPAAD